MKKSMNLLCLVVVCTVICGKGRTAASSSLRNIVDNEEGTTRGALTNNRSAKASREESINATELDCQMRWLALEYAMDRLLSWVDDEASRQISRQQVYDALQLDKCRRMATNSNTTVSVTSRTSSTNGITEREKRRQRRTTETRREESFSCPTKYCIFVTPSNNQVTTTPTKEAAARHDTRHPLDNTNKTTPTMLTSSSLHGALHLSRHVLGAPWETTVALQPGIHELTETLRLGPDDAGLSFSSTDAAAGGGEPVTWISGAVTLPDTLNWDYDCKINLHVRVANLTKLLKGRSIPRLPSLFSTDKRWNRARYPNGDFETTQWGYISPDRKTHAIASDQVLQWHRPPPGEPPTFEYTDFQDNRYPGIPAKNDSAMSAYNAYASGKGGVCADLWGPSVDSYWCSNASAGGWSEVDRECAMRGQLQIPVGLDYNVSSELGQMLQSWGESLRGGIVHAWHSQTWAMHMFEIADHTSHAGQFFFAPGGGRQGGRNWCRCDQCTYAARWCRQHQDPPDNTDDRLISGSWIIENVLAALDEPGEYFFDHDAQLLYVFPNKTSTDPTGLKGLRFALLESLISIENSANITIAGIGFRDTASTYMSDKWGVPSGGDWALNRLGAIFLENVERVVIANCTFRRLDGNGIFLSMRTRRVRIRRNRFEWLGENGIATWGKTASFDGLDREFPTLTIVEENLFRELGIYQKQSSAFGQAKAAFSIVLGNLMFNMPRAAINFNDMLGGGDVVHDNLIFNSCRESGDHGPINTWDRQPFLTDFLNPGTPSFRPVPRLITKNFIFANYGAGWGVDNDDGSSWYEVSKNVFYASQGFKMDYGGHDSRFLHNLVISFPSKWSQLCVGFGSFLEGHGHVVINNTCIVPRSDQPIVFYPRCEHNHLIGRVSRNRYFTPNGTALAQCGNGEALMSWDDFRNRSGLEDGSVVLQHPRQARRVTSMARRFLGF